MTEVSQLKGWKINLVPYTMEVPIYDSEGSPVMREGRPVLRKESIDIKHNLCTMLFNPNLRLNPENMFKSKDIVDKIRAADTSVILDTAEMELVRKAYGSLQGLPEQFIEFLKRVRDAQQVDLQEVV